MSWLGLLGALLPKALDLLVGLFVKKQPPPDVSRELGRAEQQNIDLKAGTATIRAATEAAHESETRPEPDHDPNDRSLRR
ncbi:hypothetical protein [Reyranella sp.]